jgi:hypothetical protein
MSMRTIVEFNHDFVHDIRAKPEEFIAYLSQALNSGGKEEWRHLRRFGVTQVVMVHHSTDRKVVAHGTEFPIG